MTTSGFATLPNVLPATVSLSTCSFLEHFIPLPKFCAPDLHPSSPPGSPMRTHQWSVWRGAGRQFFAKTTPPVSNHQFLLHTSKSFYTCKNTYKVKGTNSVADTNGGGGYRSRLKSSSAGQHLVACSPKTSIQSHAILSVPPGYSWFMLLSKHVTCLASACNHHATSIHVSCLPISSPACLLD